MTQPTPPCEHTCWMSKPGPEWVQDQASSLKDKAGFGWRLKDASVIPPAGEAACPAHQWLAGHAAGYAAGYADGRAWAVAWLEDIADECKRDSRLAAPAAVTAASTLAHELRKAIKEPPHA